MAALYDRSMRRAEAACLARWRDELLREVSGEVLEVGAGTGANLPHYPATVSRLLLVEPDRHMRRRLEARRGASRVARVEISPASLEELEAPAAGFDAIVTTLVFCSVPDLAASLARVFELLRPGGSLVFLEHVAAPAGSRVFTWQRRLAPIWRWLAGGCNLTRRTEAAILAAGFRFDWIRRESLCEAPALVRPSIRGVARRPPLASRREPSGSLLSAEHSTLDRARPPVSQ